MILGAVAAILRPGGSKTKGESQHTKVEASRQTDKA